MDKYTDPDFRKSVLIRINTQQNTFDNRPMEVPGKSLIIPGMKKLLMLLGRKRNLLFTLLEFIKSMEIMLISAEGL